MKKKIILFLGIGSVVFILAGMYIIASIERTTSDLDKLIKLHQVEILREHLLIQIKRVESDLNLKGTRYARGIDTIVRDVTNMGNAVDVCFDCHHNRAVMERLTDLKMDIGLYKDSLSRVLTIRANASRLEAEEDSAFKIGEELIAKVNTMIALTNKKLMRKTASALDDIAETKATLFFLVAMGPFVAAGFAFFVIRGFTGQVNLLLSATRKLKGGDLDYRVGPLNDELGEVADSFNEMAVSLREQMYRIEESEKRYRMLFEKAGDAIFILDAEGENRLRIVAANQAAAEMHGYTVDELLKLKMTDIDAAESAEKATEAVERMLRGEWINMEISHLTKDGTVFPVEVSAGLLELGGHKYILAFERDITERKRAEETLQRAEQLKVAGDLAAGLTHELKNSLAGIKVSIEVLLDELVLSEDDRNVMTNMISEVRRIELLMRDLLNFARPARPHLAVVDINTVLETAMMFSLPQALAPSLNGSIHVVKVFDDHLPKTMADPMQLQQVFMNLLLNAVEAMPEGGTLTVRTWYEPSENSIHMSIADTGKGIDEEMVGKIFEPFFTTKPKGTGLGLPITKQLIEQHGGVLRLENNTAGGVTFSMIFPVKDVEEVTIT